jgi:predicted lipoprotein with Yx(FWY)xxD motif
MKQRIRIGAVLAVVAAVGVFGAVGAGAHAKPRVHAAPKVHARPAASGQTKFTLEKAKFGSVLVIDGDEVAFLFTKGNSISDCTGTCASVWPPLLSSHPVAGAGVNAKMLGTVARGSKRQVTYDGHLLYLYADGKASYDLAYVGVKQFGGVWDAVKANGAGVK